MKAVSGRYLLYGVIASEHDEGNPKLEGKRQQPIGGTIALYGTDDEGEALAILRAGGFIRPDNENWSAVTWAKDTKTGNRIGAVPEGAK